MTDQSQTWFSSVERLMHTGLSAVFFFALVIVVVRLLGKRGVGQMTNFDWILTISVGSLMASGILINSIPVLEAAFAVVVIAVCQWLITWATVRYSIVERFLRPAPRMLLHKGQYVFEAMRKERVGRQAIDAALRHSGAVDPEEANWVTLESDGKLSVIPRKDVDLNQAPLFEEVITRMENSGDVEYDHGPSKS